MPFLATGWHLGNCSLVYLSHPTRCCLHLVGSRPLGLEVAPRLFLQSRVVEPDIVVATVVRELFLILDSTLAQDGVFK